MFITGCLPLYIFFLYAIRARLNIRTNNNRIDRAVDRGFYPWSGQTKDYKIGICCFSPKHTALSS